MQNIGHNAHMGMKWLKQLAKRKKIISIQDIADRYGVHRNTATRLAKDLKIDLYDFNSVYTNLLILDIARDNFPKIPKEFSRKLMYESLTDLLGEKAFGEIYEKYIAKIDQG